MMFECYGCPENFECPECFECFECFDPFTHKVWIGKLNILMTKDNFYELIISRRYCSFHVILIKHSFGAVICIPNVEVCCKLSSLSDVLVNQKSLARHIADVDAITIATALEHLADLYDFEEGEL